MPVIEAVVVEIGGHHIDLVQGGPGVRVFMQKAEPQPPNLPDGIVLVELPNNCYINFTAPISAITFSKE